MKANILIIDDNPKNIQLAANVLKETALYNIYFAMNAKDGIEKLQEIDISLILLDINMPLMNGYEAADIIKKDPRTTKIPIIFLSANANQESINSGFEHGGADYVTKPFQALELIHRVRTHVELFESKKALEYELEDSHLLLEQYKNAMDAGLLVSKTDLNGVITYISDNFCRVSGYTREELIGQSSDIFTPESKKSLMKKVIAILKKKKIWSGSLENRRKYGSSFFVEARMLPIVNHDGEITELMSVLADTTKQMELSNDIINSQKEILFTFGELSEMRSRETGHHVKRVSLFSELLGEKLGLPEYQTELLKLASPMHDIGKVIIPDAILLKPAKLTSQEFEVMKNHTSYGYDIFKNSKYEILQKAALIAHEHHERYDGNGYPRGLKGEEISIEGRITVLVDVFDALICKRVYKKAWSFEDTIAFIKEARGKAFDPKIVDIFLENIDAIMQIKERYNK